MCAWAKQKHREYRNIKYWREKILKKLCIFICLEMDFKYRTSRLCHKRAGLNHSAGNRSCTRTNSRTRIKGRSNAKEMNERQNKPNDKRRTKRSLKNAGQIKKYAQMNICEATRMHAEYINVRYGNINKITQITTKPYVRLALKWLNILSFALIWTLAGALLREISQKLPSSKRFFFW